MQFYLKKIASKHCSIASRTFEVYTFGSITMNRSKMNFINT